MNRTNHKAGPGRPKGSPNRNKLNVRAEIEEALGEGLISRILKLARGSPKELDTLVMLVQYCYPKLTAVEVTPAPTQGLLTDEQIETQKADKVIALRLMKEEE